MVAHAVVVGAKTARTGSRRTGRRVGRDALEVLDALPAEQADPRVADALALLALIAGQDVDLVDEGSDPPAWRIAQRVAPDRVISAVDPEATRPSRGARTGSRPTSRLSRTPGSSPTAR
jgi:hypothetical protein